LDPWYNRAVLLTARGISKYYGAQAALQEVDFDLQAGEVHALCGINGAGKSTLVKILYGAERQDSGSIEHAPDLKIAYIPQELHLAPHLTVAENIYMGNLPRRSGLPAVDWGAIERGARQAAEAVGLHAQIAEPAGRLSAAEQQLVSIARALARQATVLILDEPTAALSPGEIHRLFDMLGGLRERGNGMIYISHRLEEIERIAQRVTVLRDGRRVFSGPRTEVKGADIVRHMTGGREAAAVAAGSGRFGEELLAVRNLSLDGRLHEITFSVRGGEILGIGGVVGSGRTSLLRALFGAEPSVTGEVRVGGKLTHITSPGEAIRHGLALLTEDRKAQGLVLTADVATNLSLAAARLFSHWGWFNHARERAVAAEYVTRLSIRTPAVTFPVKMLSGGNQQKVLLARWLCTQAKIFFLDEPTRGIDVEAKQQVYALVREMAAQGAAVVLVSSELEEVTALADRILVLDRGTVKGELPRGSSEHQILMTALGADI
jgi:ABC-type sugar transport system ATPase subunit